MCQWVRCGPVHMCQMHIGNAWNNPSSVDVELYVDYIIVKYHSWQERSSAS